MKSGLVASKETSLASRLDAESAREVIHRALASASVAADIDPAFEASIVAWADGLPLALDVAVRAISTFGAKAVADAPERTLLGAESPLRRALLQAWDEANDRERSLLVLLAAWEHVVAPALLAEHVTLEVLEALRHKGLSVSEPSARIGELCLRLVRPMRALVRETAGAQALLEAYAIHARVVARAASELTTQFEITGEIAGLREVLPEVVTLCRRANADSKLVASALVASPALAPIASFDGLTPADHQAWTELVNVARASEGSTLAFGRAVLALSVAARARRDAREMLAKLANEALGVAQARDDRALEGRALRLLGAILLDAGQYEEAQVTLLGALDALEEGGDDVHRGIALEFLAMAKGRLGQFGDAIELLREAIELHRALGNRRLLLYEQSTLGALYAQSGELRRGRLATEEVVQLARAVGDRTAEAFARATLSYTYLGEGDTTRAKSEAVRSAEMFRDAGQRSLAAYGVGVAAIARLVEGDIDGGVAMLDEATSAAKPADRALYGAYVATVEAKDDLFAQARERVASARALLDTESPVVGAAVDVLAQAVEWLEHRGAALVLPASPSVDLRVAILWLSRLGVPFTRPSRAPAAEAACLVRSDGAAFSRGGVLVRLGAKPVLRKLTSALASARREAPGEPVSVEALVAHVWAGERMLERSARTRMHACILRLRQLGLRGALVQSEGGYYLDPGETETVDELAG